MGAFLIRRLFGGLIAITGVCVIVFLFLHLIPGDPIDQITGGEAKPEQRQELERCLHLDKSLPAQFGVFVGNIFDGSLGRQCPNPESKPTVMALIRENFTYTLELAIASLFVAMLLSIPLGLIAAVRRGTWVDTLAAVISMAGLAIPVILLGPLLIRVFFVKLGWLPGPNQADASFALVLPAIAIGTALMAMQARMIRTATVDVLGADFVRTAKAKGLAPRIVLWKHAFRNALLPVITIIGMQFGALLSGAIVTEKVFSRPGLGTLLLEGIETRNYPLVQGTILVVAAIYVLVNVLVDIAYGIADPRIRLGDS